MTKKQQIITFKKQIFDIFAFERTETIFFIKFIIFDLIDCCSSMDCVGIMSSDAR